MNTLYVAWQDPETRSWLPVGRLSRRDGLYRFDYTHGATKSARFMPFGRMTDLNKSYVSTALFPLFANRLLAKSRPEYQDYLHWLGLEADPNDPLLLLARSGGARGTDLLEVFPRPETNASGEYELYFFSHGLRYIAPESLARIRLLSKGDLLELVPDPANPADSYAIVLHTDDHLNVGYCPRYLTADFHRLLEAEVKWRLTVARINPDAPIQFRLLCRLVFSAPEPTQFFSGEEFQPLSTQ